MGKSFWWTQGKVGTSIRLLSSHVGSKRFKRLLYVAVLEHMWSLLICSFCFSKENVSFINDFVLQSVRIILEFCELLPSEVDITLYLRKLNCLVQQYQWLKSFSRGFSLTLQEATDLVPSRVLKKQPWLYQEIFLRICLERNKDKTIPKVPRDLLMLQVSLYSLMHVPCACRFCPFWFNIHSTHCSMTSRLPS